MTERHHFHFMKTATSEEDTVHKNKRASAILQTTRLHPRDVKGRRSGSIHQTTREIITAKRHNTITALFVFSIKHTCNQRKDKLNFYEKFGLVGSFYPFVFIIFHVPPSLFPHLLHLLLLSPYLISLPLCRLSSLHVRSLPRKVRFSEVNREHCFFLLSVRYSSSIFTRVIVLLKIISPTLTFPDFISSSSREYPQRT